MKKRWIFHFLFRWFQPLHTFHTDSSLDLSSADKHISCSFSPWVSPLNTQITQSRNLKRGWGHAKVRVHQHMPSSCCVLLNGGHRSVKMCPQNLLTGDLLDHELPVTFQPAYQPVFLIVVAHCKKATCSPSTVNNQLFYLFFCLGGGGKWQNWKEVELTFKAGAWINTNQSSRLTEQNP